MPMNFGLVKFGYNSEIQAEEDAYQQAKTDAEAEHSEIFISSLAAHINKEWERNRNHKTNGIQERLMACLRARTGEYDSKTKAAIEQMGGSDIFMNITATKCRAGAAWIKDILFPAGDKSWGIDTTPIPDIPQAIMQLIQQQAMQEMQAMSESGEQIDESTMARIVEDIKQKVKNEARDRAKKASEKMELKMEDQLAEGKWLSAMLEFIDDFVTFPTAILKGPIVRRKPVLKWGAGMVPEQKFELVYEFERVSPFNAYPAPGAATTEEGTFIERIPFSRKALYELKENPGYKADEISAVLEEHGRDGLRLWLWEDNEREQIESGSNSFYQQNNTYEIDGLHYWGTAQGKMLLEWGISVDQIDDPLREYEIEAILIGNHVVRCKINSDPLFRRPYQSACYQPVPGSLWGQGIPELMADVQRMCNATARSLSNNLGIASGPQVEVDISRMADGEDYTAMYPWRVWQVKRDQMASNNRAINFFQPNSNAAELLSVYEQFERRADDVTNIPRYTYGNERVGGAGTTAAGLSMLLDSAAKGIRSAVHNIDQCIIKNALEKLWYYNMKFDEDPEIKGDSKVITKGSSVLIAKEVNKQRMNELLAITNNEVDLGIIGTDGRAEVLRQIFKQADMEGVVPEREVMQQQLAAQQKAAENTPNPEEVRYEMEDARKREETEIDAQIEREKMDTDVHIAEIQANAAKESRRTSE